MPVLVMKFGGTSVATLDRIRRAAKRVGVEVAKGYTPGFRPQAVDAKSNLAYGYDVDESGHYALYSMSLDGANTRTKVFAVSDYDVDDVVTLGRRGRVIGASYATEKRYVRYFDPVMDELATALAGALPGRPPINIAGASSDENELLVIAASDTDPGMLYMFDQTAKSLSPLLPIREETVGRQLASMKAVTYTAADGTRVPAYLTLPPGSDGKNLPAVVMPHGGPSARDEWGFDWLWLGCPGSMYNQLISAWSELTGMDLVEQSLHALSPEERQAIQA